MRCAPRSVLLHPQWSAGAEPQGHHRRVPLIAAAARPSSSPTLSAHAREGSDVTRDSGPAPAAPNRTCPERAPRVATHLQASRHGAHSLLGSAAQRTNNGTPTAEELRRADGTAHARAAPFKRRCHRQERGAPAVVSAGGPSHRCRVCASQLCTAAGVTHFASFRSPTSSVSAAARFCSQSRGD